MPAAAMLHDVDPRIALKRKIGDVSAIEVCHNQVLVAIYMRPEQTKGKIILTDATREEDRYQGKVGLILKCGPKAFDDPTGVWQWPQDLGVDDWVYFRVSDGWGVTVNANRENLCRMLDDIHIRGRIENPDDIW